ncbi:sigma-70 family RNA polymerase sigma factor [Parvibaculum sp.]|uniref:sigma-70 family RNA polymerase sigma factor n=1 Tax=Parvibaculum sp. TaxID=2024848 RepID=UPI00272EFDA0|nr:sigma-70 family RNA polymerase sigma factor [Parvibaculum sp.]MDP1625633.1 sigma-70 family RNA polymerase sigma factor [Parvibaculum sp.]MDP2148996.1 sigma-70 family RNA polymerase sigma factor [Parvibaculum sp.]MDP3328614.1 sigma-70 family RNA polymerase sigma factor [Parvibaculum sp.]
MTATAKPTDTDRIFERHRGRAFAVAYRILGSASDAEDAVQEAWLRWRGTDTAGIRNPEAWLVTTVARLAIDQLRTARARRETYIGPWLPEPIVSAARESDPTPEDRLSLADDISMALLHVLERLAPEERAAFLLHDAFDYDYGELAALLGKSEAACRQTVSRARRRVQETHPRFDTSAREHARLAAAFSAAISSADPQALIACFTEDVVFYSDGGGKAIAALNPIHGADHVMRFFFGILKKRPEALNARPALVNGLPGFVMTEGETIHSTLGFAITGGKISALYMMRNPDKLGRVEL